MKDKIHYAIKEKEPRGHWYLCNQAVKPSHFLKLAFKKRDVTCKNCLKILKGESKQ